MEESHMESEKPQNSKRKLKKTVVDSFNKLVNRQDNVRIKSASNLLKYLSEKLPSEEGSNELKYTLKRLVRGLGGSTPTARIGYYTTLVVLLNLFDVAAKDILELIKVELHKSGGNSDGENADICIGQILTCGAIISSNLWRKTTKKEKKEIIEVLINASKERSYLGLLGYSFLVPLLDQISQNVFEEIILPSVEPEIKKQWSEQTLDSLYILLNLSVKFPNIIGHEFIEMAIGTREIICEDSIEPLSNILMYVPRMACIKHPVYDEVVNQLNSDILPIFFQTLDRHLRSTNRNRLLVFVKLLSNTCLLISKEMDAYSTLIPNLLTENFIRQMLAYFKTHVGNQKDKEFEVPVYKFFDVLSSTLNSEKVHFTTKIAVLKKFLFKPGTFIFEKRTKSKIIQQITSNLDTRGVKELAIVYKSVTEGTEEIESGNEHWWNADRLYSAHLLIKLLNHPNMKTEIDWKVEQLNFLMSLALSKDFNGLVIGRELSDSLKTAFFGALDLKLSKLEDLHTILFQLVQNIDTWINSESQEIKLREPLTEEAYELWQKTLTVIKKIEKKKKKNDLKAVFLTLFLHMSLQLFNDVKLATDSLKELHSCYERVKKDKKDLEGAGDNDPLWIEVVTDLFLNLLSLNSHLMRNVINSVFPHLCKHMTSGTIHQILSIFDPQNENPLSKNDDEDSESEISEDSEDDEQSESDSEDDETPTVNEQLRIALHQALSKGDTANDDESVDLDQMSENEGEELDEALVQAFKKFKPNLGKTKKQSRDQESLTHFRVRVLDLIEIYLDSCPSMLLALEIMLPLLQSVEFAVRDEHQKPLYDRLRSVLKKLLSLKTFSDTEGVTGDVLVILLKSLLEKGTKNIIIVQDMSEQISNCSLFIIKCSEILTNLKVASKSARKEIAKVLKQELEQFFNKRDCLTPYVLFKSVFQMSWKGNLNLIPLLLQYLFSADIKQFKKNQVAELLRLFYLNQRLLSQCSDKAEKKLLEDHATFSINVVRFFRGLCEEPDNNIKERLICNLFTLLTSMKQSVVKTDVDWKEIAEIVREYRTYKTFSKDAKVAFNKLCSALGVSNVVAMKSNPSKLKPTLDGDLKDDEPGEGKKKQQKRVKKENLKLRKEAKRLRLEGLSEGLSSSVNFMPADDVQQTQDDKQKKNKSTTNGVVNGKITGGKTKLKLEVTGVIKKKRKLSG